MHKTERERLVFKLHIAQSNVKHTKEGLQYFEKMVKEYKEKLRKNEQELKKAKSLVVSHDKLAKKVPL